MVIIGVDAHKRSHTLVAVDDNGRRLAEKSIAATPDGHLEGLAWAGRWPERRFAIEDCRHLTRRLEIDPLRAGEAIVRVPPHLMAGARSSGRERGKSDPIDALAVARVGLREPDLPVAHLDGEARPRASAGSGPRRRSPAGTGPRHSRCGRATSRVTGCRGPATAR